MANVFYWDKERKRFHVYSEGSGFFNLVNASTDDVVAYEKVIRRVTRASETEFRKFLGDIRKGKSPKDYPSFESAVAEDADQRRHCKPSTIDWDEDPRKQIESWREFYRWPKD